MNKSNRVYPKVGDKLYLSQRTGNSWVDMVKRPYTVIGIWGGKVIIQSAKCNFPEKRYFNTLPTSIELDPQGDILELHWSPKHNMWQNSKDCYGYPEFAFFGSWQYQPYLN